MDMVMETFDKVRKVVGEWMKPTWKCWDENHFSWGYSTENGKFQWSCFNHYCNDGIEIGGEFPCHNCIEIWTGKRDNVNIFISERGIVFNADSKSIGFSHKEIYTLYGALVDNFVENITEEEAEEIMNNNLEKESNPTGINIDNHKPGIIVKQKFDLNYFELYNAYAIYDRADVCAHGILISANENVLTFCTYGIRGNGRTDLIIDIDEYTEGKFTIKPLIVGEQ